MEQLAAYQMRHAQFLQLHQLLSTYSGLYKETQRELVEYKTKAHYWEAQFNQLKTREEGIKAELEELKAQLRKRERQLFDKKSERTHKRSDSSTKIKSTRKRGQQVGNPPPGSLPISWSMISSFIAIVCVLL
jgi:chromosome segregation ATPase